MRIDVQRIYDDTQEPGFRVLVDRLWPRGITKQRAALDEWCKELAPSPELRKWFAHDPAKFADFRREHLKELAGKEQVAEELLTRAGKRRLVLLYGAKDPQCNHAIVLKDFLTRLSGR